MALRSTPSAPRPVRSGAFPLASISTSPSDPYPAALPSSVGDTVILRGSCFRPGRTFRNYLFHLKKARLLTECSFDRCTTAVREIARGLKHAKKNSLQFPNFIYTQDLYNVINHIGREDEFSQLAFISPFLALEYLLRLYQCGRLIGARDRGDSFLRVTRSL